MKLPAPLFKYMTAERGIQVLLEKTVRFTQPKYFNDPFEICPTFDLADIKAHFLEDHEIMNELKNGGDRRELMKRFEQFAYGVVFEFAREYEAMGILSLSEKCDIPLMWSHYADYHEGVVIGFRADGGFLLSKPNTTDPKNYCDIGPVEYMAERFKYPTDIKQGIDYIWSKDTCWGYEKEWRIVRGLDTLIKKSNDVYVSSFHPESVRCVIFGLKTPKDQVASFMKILKSDEFKHVHTYATMQNTHDFGLDIITARERSMMEADLSDEILYVNPDMGHLEKLISKGDLYKAMEIIDQEVVFELNKDSLDFNP